MECAKTVGQWAVIEYEHSSGRTVKLWSFPSFSDAEVFRLKREEFYRTVGFETTRFTPPLPKISDAEMELFETIIKNPRLMRHIMHQFVG
jgi:hypothetical protein